MPSDAVIQNNPDQPTNDQPTVGLVLGAGGTLGGSWIRGALDGLEAVAGFRPAQATVIQGTSIGAFITGRLGGSEPLPADVFDALGRVATVPEPPSIRDRLVHGARLGAGALVAAAAVTGRDDPRDWVQEVAPDAAGRVVSMRSLPPRRRVAGLAAADDPTAEIAASGAVPFVARPVRFDGRRHCDGAAWSLTNADLVGPGDVDLLVVIAPRVTSDGGSATSWTGRHQLRVELAPWATANRPCIVVAPTSEEFERRNDRDRHHDDARARVERLAAGA
ncbi:MAG: hypothetical protein ACRBI6_09985 [Acidimicrobiales bacterium]